MKRLKESFTAFFLFCIVFILIAFSKQAKQGATEGINLCEGIIIPSLLPVLIICNLIIKSNSTRIFEKLFGTAFEKTFHLNRSAMPAVLLGLIGGFPSGAVLTCELYKTNSITQKETERIMRFNFCGGGAFIISAVGTIIYKSAKIGILLFSCSVLSSLLIAFFSSFFYDKPQKSEVIKTSVSLSDALCKSVETTVKSLAVMSAYIILFSALCKIVSVPSFLVPLIEITNGICNSKKLLPLPFCAFFLSFGGFCIHFQILSFLKEMKIKYFDFFIFRVLGSALSYFICKIIIHFSNDTSFVFASLSPNIPFEISRLGGGLSALMIIGCAVIVFDIENRKLELIK